MQLFNVQRSTFNFSLYLCTRIFKNAAFEDASLAVSDWAFRSSEICDSNTITHYSHH